MTEAGPSVRVLGSDDLDEALRLLGTNPIDNIFITSRLEVAGLDPYLLGCEVLGLHRGGRLQALCHVGSNLVPVLARIDGQVDVEALQAFAHRVGPRRRVSSMMGVADQVLPLWEELGRRWGASWTSPREVRAHQPVMVVRGPALVESDPRVRQVTMDDFDAYFDAAVKMYTEEVGVSPLEPTGSYANHVRRTIGQGRAFGIIEDGQVLYKSDVGCATGEVCQIQGVWLRDDLRGRGLSEPAMAAVVELCRPRWPVVSLYVNDYNTRARRLYERIGFDTVGEFATVLF